MRRVSSVPSLVDYAALFPSTRSTPSAAAHAAAAVGATTSPSFNAVRHRRNHAHPTSPIPVNHPLLSSSSTSSSPPSSSLLLHSTSLGSNNSSNGMTGGVSGNGLNSSSVNNSTNNGFNNSSFSNVHNNSISNGLFNGNHQQVMNPMERSERGTGLPNLFPLISPSLLQTPPSHSTTSHFVTSRLTSNSSNANTNADNNDPRSMDYISHLVYHQQSQLAMLHSKHTNYPYPLIKTPPLPIDRASVAADEFKWGVILIIMAILIFVVTMYTMVLSKFLPTWGSPVLQAIKDDTYYCFLLPVAYPAFLFFHWISWFSLKFFRHG